MMQISRGWLIVRIRACDEIERPSTKCSNVSCTSQNRVVLPPECSDRVGNTPPCGSGSNPTKSATERLISNLFFKQNSLNLSFSNYLISNEITSDDDGRTSRGSKGSMSYRDARMEGHGRSKSDWVTSELCLG